MYKITLSAALTIVLATTGCSGKKKQEGLEPPLPVPVGSGSAVGSATTGSGAGSATATPKLASVTLKDVGFMTPESVLYDAVADVYLVSNINGKPTDADDNGFISRLSPDDRKVTELKWIDGSKPDVKLDAPKGMVISDGVLWVADITVVRKFDAKTGKPMGEVKIDGAKFLNDVAPAPGGGVYVTDTENEAVYAIFKTGVVKPLIKQKDLGGPNGVVIVGDVVWVVTKAGTMFSVPDGRAGSPAASEPKPTKLPKSQLDGIVAIDGEFMVSSWDGKTVYRGKPDQWKDLALDLESPADIGWDSKRNKLLVPLFNADAVTIVDF